MEWISIKDKLPELDIEVLIFLNPNPIKYPKGIFIAYRGLVNGHWCNEEIKEGEFINVTHWMPLPAPPKNTI